MTFLSRGQPYLQWQLSVLPPPLLTRRSRPYLTLPKLSMLFPGVVGVEDAASEVAAVEAVEEAKIKIKTKVQTRPLQVRSTKALSTPTYRLETGRGALCTSAGAGVLSFVVSQHPAHGRMSMPRSLQTNETGTSSVLIMTL